MNKLDLILAGVGGQGILTLSTILGQTALAEGLHIKQSEVHGMAQRGGAVVSHFRFNNQQPNSSLIPRGKADVILSLEPIEGLRYLPWLNKNGMFVSATSEVKNIPNYPESKQWKKEINKLPRKLTVDAQKIARQGNLRKGTNTVLLGAASPYLRLPDESIITALKEQFAEQGEEIVEKNLSLFEKGQKLAASSPH